MNPRRSSSALLLVLALLASMAFVRRVGARFLIALIAPA